MADAAPGTLAPPTTRDLLRFATLNREKALLDGKTDHLEASRDYLFKAADIPQDLFSSQ